MSINIPPYWAKAEHRDGKESIVATGWSVHSVNEALDHARTRAARLFELIHAGKKPDTYEYGSSPIREQILETISTEEGELALISRNRYGAAVLNTDCVLFADVDFKPLASAGFMNGLSELINSSKKEKRAEAQRRAEIDQVIAWGEQNREHPFRLYRTFAGLRLLFTARTYDPKAPATIALLTSLGSDPLYIRLTQKQACFRARLTPKPWRIQMERPPVSYPFTDAAESSRYQEWLSRYLSRIGHYRCCTLIDEGRRVASLAAVHKVIAIHDRMTGVHQDNLPLA